MRKKEPPAAAAAHSHERWRIVDEKLEWFHSHLLASLVTLFLRACRCRLLSVSNSVIFVYGDTKNDFLAVCRIHQLVMEWKFYFISFYSFFFFYFYFCYCQGWRRHFAIRRSDGILMAFHTFSHIHTHKLPLLRKTYNTGCDLHSNAYIFRIATAKNHLRVHWIRTHFCLIRAVCMCECQFSPFALYFRLVVRLSRRQQVLDLYTSRYRCINNCRHFCIFFFAREPSLSLVFSFPLIRATSKFEVYREKEQHRNSCHYDMFRIERKHIYSISMYSTYFCMILIIFYYLFVQIMWSECNAWLL